MPASKQFVVPKAFDKRAGRASGKRHKLQCALAGRCPALPCQAEPESQGQRLNDGCFEADPGQLLPALHQLCRQNTFHTHSGSVHTIGVCSSFTLSAPDCYSCSNILHKECCGLITWGPKENYISTKVESHGV